MMSEQWKQIQRWAGVADDGVPGPATARAIIAKAGIAAADPAFDRAAFLARHVNTSAPAIRPDDITRAAVALQVTEKHVRAIQKVESSGQSFDNAGRPVILFEPHIFHRRTGGKYSPSSFSYARWKDKPYPKTFDGRWQQMADAAAKDERAALESASWGLFQIMGFHWQALGYASVQEFAAAMVKSEAGHLDALVRFIKVNGLAPALFRCKAGNPDSCRDFAKGYNGGGYEANKYHVKIAEALR